MGNKVHLIVTGDMENAGLVDAFSRISVFENITFTVQKIKGITDNKIPNSFPSKGKKNRDVDKLANAMLSSVVKERSGKLPADMLVIVDDLELANLNQPEVVLEFFADALKNQMMEKFSSQKVQNRYFKKIKDTCSFHFFVPMGEAYFFGEVPNALERAGVSIQSKVDGSLMDVEKFQVPGHVHSNGVDYLNAPSGRKKIDPYWTINPLFRPQHPKKYIDFLCCPEIKYSKDNKEKFYKEYRKNGVSGTNALKTLNWQQVLSNPNHAQYLRALVHDIAEKFAIYPLPFPGECASLTKYTGQGGILRNF